MQHELPLGQNYLYCPRGPTGLRPEFPISNFQFSNDITNDSIKEFLKKSVEVARKEKSIFVRWDPPFAFAKNQISNIKYQKYGFGYHANSVRSVQPQHTVWMDLTKTDEELLSGMREKTRYNIRLAERRGVAVRYADRKERIEIFWKLLKETAKRDGFSTHPKEHYEKLWEAFTPPLAARASREDCQDPFVRLYLAEYAGAPLAAAIVMFCGGIATYVHGASSSELRNMMAPYLLHWRIMQDAKTGGYAVYDLWGIDDANPRWAGMTRFKHGFGGTGFSYANSIDIVAKPMWHAAYCLAKKIF